MSIAALSDRSIPTYFKLALHASIAAEYWRELARKTRSKREWALHVRSAEIEESLAEQAWRKFTAKSARLAVVISPKGRTILVKEPV